MALTASTLSLVSLSNQSVNLAATAASGGTGPYTNQWYSSTTTGFSPGAGNLISGATGLTLAQSGLAAQTGYFYKVVNTDTGAGNATVTSSQLAVTTQPAPGQNQFAQMAFVGTCVQPYSYNTVPCMVDAAQSAPILAGQAVKLIPNVGQGVPQIGALTGATDVVFGFANFNSKNQAWLPGQALEVSCSGNVVNLYATAAVTQGAQLQVDITTLGGVTTGVGSSGAQYVGYAVDGTAAAGTIRVHVTTPSFRVF